MHVGHGSISQCPLRADCAVWLRVRPVAAGPGYQGPRQGRTAAVAAAPTPLSRRGDVALQADLTKPDRGSAVAATFYIRPNATVRMTRDIRPTQPHIADIHRHIHSCLAVRACWIMMHCQSVCCACATMLQAVYHGKGRHLHEQSHLMTEATGWAAPQSSHILHGRPYQITLIDPMAAQPHKPPAREQLLLSSLEACVHVACGVRPGRQTWHCTDQIGRHGSGSAGDGRQRRAAGGLPAALPQYARAIVHPDHRRLTRPAAASAHDTSASDAARTVPCQHQTGW